MSCGHKWGETNFRGKGRSVERISGTFGDDGLTWILSLWNEIKCKRNSAVKVHLDSPFFLRSTFPEFPFCLLNSSHEEWCCAKVIHALPQGRSLPAWGPHGGRGWPSPSPRATLSHPMACTLTEASQPHDPTKVRSPAWWSSVQHFCQQCQVLRVLRLFLYSSKQIPQIFRGPSSLP